MGLQHQSHDNSDTGFELSVLSSNTRRQLKRAMALYEEKGPLTLERAQNASQALDWYDDLIRLHTLKWENQPTDTPATRAENHAFNKQLISYGEGEVIYEVLRARAGDQPIGYLFNLINSDMAAFVMGGFVQETDNKLKPGLVTHYLAMDHHRREGTLAYDFLGGDARYKKSLSQRTYPMMSLVIQRKTLRTRLERIARMIKRRVVS